MAANVAQLVRDAALARQRGDVQEQRRLIFAAVKASPTHPHALNAFGLLALEDGYPSDAVTAFAKAAEADPGEVALWMNLATAHRAMKDDAGEEAALDHALALDQRYFIALLRKAELYQRIGQTAKASYNWQAVIALAPSIDPMPSALAATIEQGRRFVTEQTRGFADAIDAGLSADLAAIPAEDRRRFDACVDHALGRRTIYRNECAGLHYPFLPADEFFDRRHFPWLEAFEAQTDAIRAEALALLDRRDGIRPYVPASPGAPATKWSPFEGSLDWGAYFLWEYGERIEAACAACPATAAALAAVPQTQLPRRAPSAFFSILKPRTHIPPHTGVTNTRTIIHLPLIVPEGCGFRVGGETRRWEVGKAFAFDDTIEHEAWNDSDELRVVLIFDVWNPHLAEYERTLLRRFFDVADASGHDPDGGGAN